MPTLTAALRKVVVECAVEYNACSLAAKEVEHTHQRLRLAWLERIAEYGECQMLICHYRYVYCLLSNYKSTEFIAYLKKNE